ncbi:MAG: hypothetical protein HYS12_00355, partial [Planctomycetes bacterium]|nr:hypothetical protein [Planctomycetota bacterium]
MLFKAVSRCFAKWCKTGKGLNFERIQSDVIRDGYRLAPRIFTQHTIGEIARNINKQSFIIRYVSTEDKQFALNSLSKLEAGPKLNNWSQQRGSYSPTICYFFDIAETLRALMKIGLNLIAAYSPKTPVDYQAFASAIRIIRGEMQMRPAAFRGNGFVHAEDIQCIKAGDRDHSFRLMHA